MNTFVKVSLIALFSGAILVGCGSNNDDSNVNDELSLLNASLKLDLDNATQQTEKLQTVIDSTPQMGTRPFYLVDGLPEGELKTKLASCEKGPFYKTDFSIGHRGAPLQYPEHTKESYLAAARMGAGILECDVTFTKDRELVCRHSQCDLHTTTNILETELAANCSEPFSPADPLATSDNKLKRATAKCCTSDITLAEFKTLQGKMDAANPFAKNVKEYLDGTAKWRTDLYASRGTLLTHAESIELFKSLGAKFTPELKSPSVDMPYEGEFTQEEYAQKMIDEYNQAGVNPEEVWPQSFNLKDVLYWLEKEPMFGQQAVYLDARVYPNLNPDMDAIIKDFANLVEQGVKVIAPPLYALLTVENGEIVPSEYAIKAKEAGLDIITWTLERSGTLTDGGGWYYSTVNELIKQDSDMLVALDVLVKEVGVIGVFSDWPATTTFYANCMDM